MFPDIAFVLLSVQFFGGMTNLQDFGWLKNNGGPIRLCSVTQIFSGFAVAVRVFVLVAGP